MHQDAATGNSGKNTRRVFISLCLVPFVLLPLLCLDAGISGDEPVHYTQAENVYRYFSTHGKDSSSIDTPITYLKYYGQSIDNFSYLINKTFGFKEPYLTRHIINALAGALTIAFTGFLAAEIAGYGAGILAILFLLISPVFLGHTYNNLKDVPSEVPQEIAGHSFRIPRRNCHRNRFRNFHTGGRSGHHSDHPCFFSPAGLDQATYGKQG
jgi:hypothetical protein